MIPTILQTRFFVFVILFIHSFPLFALAAPVPDTPGTSSVIRKREPQHDSHPSVLSRDNEVSEVLTRSPAASYLNGRSPTISRRVPASADRESHTHVRRFFGKIFRGIKNAAKRVAHGVKRVVHGVKHGVSSYHALLSSKRLHHGSCSCS
jgi:hypothetical protein